MQELFEQYTQLNVQLATLPLDYELAAEELASLRMTEWRTKNDLDTAEVDMIQAAGGRKGLGSNDKERDDAVTLLKRINANYGAANRLYTAARLDVTAQEIVLGRIEKQWQAVGYQSRLLSGLFNYLGSAGVPVAMNAKGVMVEADASLFGV